MKVYPFKNQLEVNTRVRESPFCEILFARITKTSDVSILDYLTLTCQGQLFGEMLGEWNGAGADTLWFEINIWNINFLHLRQLVHHLD